MERDFMGLNSKDPFCKVKEEVDESSQHSGFPKGYGILWPSSSKVSVDPYSMSMAAKDEKPPGHSPDLLVPQIAMTLSDGCNLVNNLQPAENQNFASTIMKLPVFGRIPATKSHLVHPCKAFVAGMTEPSCTSESGAPAELTIFYAGKVNVYKDISPEKAQAIMFLAGNGCSTSDRQPPEVQVQAPAPNYLARDDAFVNNIIDTSLCSALSSPMSVSSHVTGQMIGGLIKNEESRAYKAIGISTFNISEVPTSKLETSLRPSPTSILSSAIPQARKASLARFLQKRKERVMSSSPYLLGNKSGEGTAESSAGFSATSGVGSRSMSIEKDINI